MSEKHEPTRVYYVELDPSQEAIEALHVHLMEYNIRAANVDESERVAAFARNDRGEMIGGAYGRIWGDCIEVHYVWVAEETRGQGVGRRILAMLEEEVRSRGCRIVMLDTYTFKAPGFYERLGYEEFGRIGGFPRGIEKVFFRKHLD